MTYCQPSLARCRRDINESWWWDKMFNLLRCRCPRSIPENNWYEFQQSEADSLTAVGTITPYPWPVGRKNFSVVSFSFIFVYKIAFKAFTSCCMQSTASRNNTWLQYKVVVDNRPYIYIASTDFDDFLWENSYVYNKYCQTIKTQNCINYIYLPEGEINILIQPFILESYTSNSDDILSSDIYEYKYLL